MLTELGGGGPWRPGTREERDLGKTVGEQEPAATRRDRHCHRPACKGTPRRERRVRRQRRQEGDQCQGRREVATAKEEAQAAGGGGTVESAQLLFRGHL